MDAIRHLWLVGMMGSGKSVVGPRMALRLGLPFVDTDAEIVNRTGASIAQLWMQRGEAGFRELESTTIARVAAGDASVVATGGGAILDPANVMAMRASGRVLWLSASADTLRERLGSGVGRPLLMGDAGVGELDTIMEERRDRYAEAADHVVATDEVEIEQLVDTIEAWWRGF